MNVLKRIKNNLGFYRDLVVINKLTWAKRLTAFRRIIFPESIIHYFQIPPPAGKK